MKYVYTFLLLGLLCNVSAQKKPDPDSLRLVIKTTRVDSTRIKATIALARSVRKTQPDTALQMLVEASRSAEKKKLYELYFESENLRAWTYRQLEKYDVSEKIYFAILSSKNLTHTGEIDAYNAMAHLYMQTRQFSKSINASFKLIKLTEKYNKPDVMASAYTGLGNLYGSWGNDGADSARSHKAMIYFEKADSVAQKYNMTDFRQNVALLNLAMAYGYCKRYDKAEATYATTFKFLSHSTNHSGYAMALGNYADMMNDLFTETKDKRYLEKGLDYATRSYNEALVANYWGILPNILVIRMDSNIGLKNWSAVEADAQQILRDHATVTNAHLVSQAWDALHQAAQAKGQFEKALMYYKKYTALQDSSDKVENIKGLHEVQTQYETEKKDEQIKQLNKDKKKDTAIRKANEARSRIILYSVLGGLLLVVVFSFFLLQRFRVSQRQKKIIENQKELVEEKQKEIIDSITYAKRLQEAILPSESAWKKEFPESFIFYKPKDIVAGDFYFLERIGNTVIVAAADCTGHGVPGAMVSVVCANALTRSVREFKLTDPGKILDKTRELVLETFSNSVSEVKDGMDIALVSLEFEIRDSKFENNLKSQISNLKFSGANNPLWYIQNNELKEIKGDKQPIGYTENTTPFTTHTISNSESQISNLFLFTDGYQDQFGGDKGKKLKASAMQKLVAQHAHLAMHEQHKKLDQHFENWRSGLEQIDDVCVLGIRL